MYVIPFSMGPVGSGLSSGWNSVDGFSLCGIKHADYDEWGSDVLQLLTENHDMDFVKY